MALYGVILLLAVIAYYVLVRVLKAIHDQDLVLKTGIESDLKEKISLFIYLSALPLAFANTLISWLSYLLIAINWLVPDRRIKKVRA